MRNLKCVQHRAIKFENANLPLTAHTWDSASNTVICTFGPSTSLPVIEIRKWSVPDRQPDEFSVSNGAVNSPDSIGNAEDELQTPLRTQGTSLLASWDALCPHPDLDVDKVLSLKYLAFQDMVCVVLAGGDIVVVNCRPHAGQEKIEIVGSVDAGILAASWSPDEELLALVTQANTLLFMTQQFDNFAAATFTADDVKLSKHVSVGWGKKETQFAGKRAKALRDPTMPETVDEGSLRVHDKGETTITWRGDGAYVAINSVEGSIRRIIRIFSREGVLENVSEPVNGLEGTLSWRPSGNLLAGIQRTQNDERVVFFERNGLRHGEFSLRRESIEDTSPIEICWNPDSTILAICFSDKIQLWTMANYHYYLKQEIELYPDGKSIPYDSCFRAVWDEEQPLRLALSRKPLTYLDTVTQELRVLSFSWVVASGPTTPPFDFGTTAVVDGSILKVTPLRTANVPPPMSLHEINLTDPINDISVNASGSRIAALGTREITLFRYDPRERTKSALQWDQTISLPLVANAYPHQIGIIGEDHVCVLYFRYDGRADVLFVAGKFLAIQDAITVEHIVSTTERSSLCFLSGSTVLLGDVSGVIENIETPGNVLMTRIIHTFPEKVVTSEVINVGAIPVAFALAVSGALYANDVLLLRGCTSFIVTPSFLVVTTTQHLLKFIHMSAPEDLEVPPDAPEVDERCRNIERGAKLVAVMPSSFAVVLQMPRGNLETICPRALVLAGIRKSIESREYHAAFLTCRSQRVDMNILHDHAPHKFLADVPIVLEQLKRTDYIDLFLSQVREEDVSETMYRETKPRDSRREESKNNPQDYQSQQVMTKKASSKVNKICDAFLAVMQNDTSIHQQNMITAHVCKNPPDVEAALQLAIALRENQADELDAAVEHICFLVDVHRVYDCALGIYDLELALLVAQQSQKDPREYLPYLRELQDLPAARRCFRIDDDLKKHVKALNHLKSLNVLNEVVEYAQKHELYAAALNLYRYDNNAQSKILRTYADFLNGRQKFQEAAIAYESLADYASASACYSSANKWRECLTTASLIPLEPTALRVQAQSLSDALVEGKDYTSAAIIQQSYLSNIETAARYLCKAYAFAEATRLVTQHSRPAYLSSVIDPGIVEASASLTELLADCKTQLNAQAPRLRELRQIKASDPLRFLEGAPTSGSADDIPDDISLAPTGASTLGASLVTRYTGRAGTGTGTIATGTSRRTSKNRRREERKRARGKKGSVYEEEYLVNSVGRLIERVNCTHEDVRATVEACGRRGMWEHARAVEKSLADVVDLCKDVVGEVFEVERGGTGGGVGVDVGDDGGERPSGGDGVLWDSLESGRRREVPAVKAYGTFTLLGG